MSPLAKKAEDLGSMKKHSITLLIAISVTVRQA
jgi:hypothetical protein